MVEKYKQTNKQTYSIVLVVASSAFLKNHDNDARHDNENKHIHHHNDALTYPNFAF